jgi:HTH-type transcriptional regulator/antitoxin HigA
MLSNAITRYENSLPAVQKMDKRIEDMDADISMLRTLMSQYGLSGSDFENEIGKRAYVSQILSGSRKLSKDHIKNLSDSFDVSPALFF